MAKLETLHFRRHLKRKSAIGGEADPMEAKQRLGMLTVVESAGDVRRNSSGTRLGPMRTIDMLEASLQSESDRANWVARARIDALTTGCKDSWGSVKSGIRCYLAFAKRILKNTEADAVPPSADDLIAWSMTFRNGKSFSNYLGYARVGCLLVNASTAAFEHPAVKRARKAVAKRKLFRPRPPMFIQMEMVSQMIEHIYLGAHPVEWENAVMLFLTTYVFMLRLPSEASVKVALWHGCVFSCAQRRHCPLFAVTLEMQTMSRPAYIWTVTASAWH